MEGTFPKDIFQELQLLELVCSGVCKISIIKNIIIFYSGIWNRTGGGTNPTF